MYASQPEPSVILLTEYLPTVIDRNYELRSVKKTFYGLPRNYERTAVNEGPEFTAMQLDLSAR